MNDFDEFGRAQFCGAIWERESVFVRELFFRISFEIHVFIFIFIKRTECQNRIHNTAHTEHNIESNFIRLWDI